MQIEVNDDLTVEWNSLPVCKSDMIGDLYRDSYSSSVISEVVLLPSGVNLISIGGPGIENRDHPLFFPFWPDFARYYVLERCVLLEV